jgi:hypothetical protein
MDTNLTQYLTGNYSALPDWQMAYVYIGPFAGYGIPSTPLLAGWWYQFFGLVQAWYVVNSIQFALVVIGVAFWARSLTLMTESALSHGMPVGILLWQALLASLNVCVPKLLISSPVTMFILVHGFVEIYILAQRLYILNKTDKLAQDVINGLLIAFVIGVTILYMASGDVYYKASFGAFSLFTDYGNAFTAIAYFAYYNSMESEGKILGLLGSILSVWHVLVYYPQALIAFLGNIEFAGIWLIAGIGLNQGILIAYLYYLWKGNGSPKLNPV